MSTASARRTCPPRRREEAKALFRNAILEAAEEVFAERGFHGARIQDIAERARIAVGTVYNHFEQKEDVLRALLEERTEQLFDQLAALPSDPEPFEERLTARLARMLRYIDNHRSFYVIALEHGLLSKGTGSAVNAMGTKRVRQVERYRSKFRSIVEEGIASGALEPMDVAPLSWFLGGVIRAFTLGALEDGKMGLEAEAPTIVRLFLRGAGAAQRSVRSRREAVKSKQ